MTTTLDSLKHRTAPIDLPADDFRAIGHHLVDSLADWLAAMPRGPVTKGESPAEIRRVFGSEGGLPDEGEPAAAVLDDAANLLFEHSLVNVETTTHMIASIADAGCVPLARVPSNRHDHIKRVLDNGAHGVVVPMVNSRAEAEAAVSACLYPPAGTRSVGGSVPALNFRCSPIA